MRRGPASFAVLEVAIALFLPPHVLPTRALPQPAERLARALGETALDAARAVRAELRDLAPLSQVGRGRLQMWAEGEAAGADG